MEVRTGLYPDKFISCPAIRYGNMMYVSGRTHDDCLECFRRNTHAGVDEDEIVKGYLVNNKNFVREEVAKHIAYSSQQINSLEEPFELKEINGWFWNEDIDKWDRKICGLCKHHDFTEPFCHPSGQTAECINLTGSGCDDFEPYYSSIHMYLEDMGARELIPQKVDVTISPSVDIFSSSV